MPKQWCGTWAGGRVSTSSRGRHFVLERRFQGRQYTFTLKAKDEAAALGALHAWNEDPADFIQAQRQRKGLTRALVADAVHIDAALLSRLKAHMETSGLS